MIRFRYSLGERFCLEVQGSGGHLPLTWPAKLQSLMLGGGFNEALDEMTWPSGLETLSFGKASWRSLAVFD